MKGYKGRATVFFNIMKIVGEYCRTIRNKRMLTLEALALISKKPVTTLSSFERGYSTSVKLLNVYIKLMNDDELHTLIELMDKM